MNCKGDFGKFGAHAKQCRDPHPEDRSGTADGDGAGDAGNITRAYSSSQSGAQRLERRRGAISRFCFVQRSANGVFQSIAEFSQLDEMRPKTQHEAHSQNADHRRDTPNKVVDVSVDRFDE